MSDISVNVNSLDNQKEDPTRRVNINPSAVDVTEDLNNLATTVRQRNEMGNSAAMEHSTINDSESNNQKRKATRNKTEDNRNVAESIELQRESNKRKKSSSVLIASNRTHSYNKFVSRQDVVTIVNRSQTK